MSVECDSLLYIYIRGERALLLEFIAFHGFRCYPLLDNLTAIFYLIHSSICSPGAGKQYTVLI